MHYYSYNGIPITPILNKRCVTKDKKFPVK